MQSIEIFERAVSISSKEFIRGFIIGQIALLLVIIVLARVLFFRSPTPPNQIRFSPQNNRKLGNKNRSGFESGLASLAKLLGVEIKELERRENCIWLNALAIQAFFNPLRRQLGKDVVIDKLSDLLSMQFNADDSLGPVIITNFELGESYPIIKWINAAGQGVWQLNLEWHDAGNIELETAVLINWPPKTQIASLPCAFSFSLKSLVATLNIELDANNDLSISILPDDFLLDLDIRSLIGHRSKLKDIPKLTSMLYWRFRNAIAQKLLLPNKVTLNISQLTNNIFPDLTSKELLD